MTGVPTGSGRSPLRAACWTAAAAWRWRTRLSWAIWKLGSRPVAAEGIAVLPISVPSGPTARNATGRLRPPAPTNQRT